MDHMGVEPKIRGVKTPQNGKGENKGSKPYFFTL